MAMAMVVAAAARTLVRVGDGDRGGDDSSASSPVPCLPAPCRMRLCGIARSLLPRSHCNAYLAFKGDSNCFFFEGNYADYEENKMQRLGKTSIRRIKYAPLVNA
jgi:hypothetical protein